jgi:plasmid stabilization system protein ParE
MPSKMLRKLQLHPGAARNFKARLVERVNSLKDMPYLCEAYDRDQFFRRMALDGYLLFYDVGEERKLIAIHRIFHHERNTDRLIAEHRARL